MSFFDAIILGLVQGLCEFLPVSSSGHLILFQKLLGVQAPGLLLEVMLHVGTLVAVFIFFWRDIWQMLRHPFTNKDVRLLIVATLPTVLVALFLKDQIEAVFSGAYLGISFLMTTGVLLLSSFFHGKREALTYKDAAIMGGFQAIALIPGLSRSGSTITGGLVSGLERKSAARFSFLMSIPAILGSLVFTLKDVAVQGPGDLPIMPLLVGMLVSMAAGLFAIRFMMKVIAKVGLKWFGLYTLVLGILVLVDQSVTHFFF